MNAIDFAEQAQDIFVLSDSFLRIKDLIDDESSTIDDIADIIVLDPALSATVLKLANSSFFNYPGKIDTISKAVLVLGITEVYNLVIAYFTMDAFKSIDADKEYLDNYWERSVDCALSIKYLATKLGIKNAERIFILGLLHNVGELVVKQISPEKVIECYEFSDAETPWGKQQEVLGFTFGECTAELLKLWQLPFVLVAPIREQDDDDIESASQDQQLLYIAKRVSIRYQDSDDSVETKYLTDDKLEQGNVSEALLKASMSYCDMERLGVLTALNPTAIMIY